MIGQLDVHPSSDTSLLAQGWVLQVDYRSGSLMGAFVTQTTPGENPTVLPGPVLRPTVLRPKGLRPIVLFPIASSEAIT